MAVSPAPAHVSILCDEIGCWIPSVMGGDEGVGDGGQMGAGMRRAYAFSARPSNVLGTLNVLSE